MTDYTNELYQQQPKYETISKQDPWITTIIKNICHLQTKQMLMFMKLV